MENFPKESTLKDTHLTTLSDGLHDVYKLIAESNKTLPIKLEVTEWLNQLSQRCWRDTQGNKFSPKELLEAYGQSESWEDLEKSRPEWAKHIKQIRDADLSFPLLLDEYAIVDGMHRLSKAVIEGASDIYVKVASPSDKTRFTSHE